jgi:hypothetical protein
VVGPRTVLVLGLDLHGLWALSDKVHVLRALVAHARAPLSVLPICSNRLLNNMRSSSPNTSNSSSGIDIRADKETCLEGM